MIVQDELRIREPREDQWIMAALVGLDDPFSRSNGTVLARLYERLTKASRRRVKSRRISNPTWVEQYMAPNEEAYRAGVYDAYSALQKELQK